MNKKLEQVRDELMRPYMGTWDKDPETVPFCVGFNKALTPEVLNHLTPSELLQIDLVKDLIRKLKIIDEDIVKIENHSEYTKPEDQRTLRRHAMWARTEVKNILRKWETETE
jgi:hypothetical protein